MVEALWGMSMQGNAQGHWTDLLALQYHEFDIFGMSVLHGHT